MKIVFFGTPAFSVPFLKALTEEPSFDVVAVVSQPDKPAGRGGELKPPATKVFADEKNLKVLQPKTLKTPEAVEALEALHADVFVVVAYGKLIPDAILAIPKLGCINVHPSLLPKHRGPSPMQWAIAEGDPVTGVSIMLLDAGMDTGPILASETISVDDNETYTTLAEKSQRVGAPLLVSTLKRHASGEITPIAQDNAKATMTRLLEREDGRVDWCGPLAVIERKARAYDGWPGVWSIWKRGADEIRLKWIQVQPADFRADVPPGTVTVKDGRMFVDAFDGTMEILELQVEGKAKMDTASFLRGYSDVSGAVLT